MLQSLRVQGLLPSHSQCFLEVSETRFIDMMFQLKLSDPHIKESTKLKAPAYTFGGRFKSSTDKVSPSPNSYNTTGLTKKGEEVYILFNLNNFEIHLFREEQHPCKYSPRQVKRPKEVLHPLP